MALLNCVLDVAVREEERVNTELWKGWFARVE